MTKTLRFAGVGLVAVLIAAAVAAVAFNGTTSADEGDMNSAQAQVTRPAPDPDALVAVAIGNVLNDTTDPTLDLRAHDANGEQGGAFRFFCEKMGYYNGAVKTLDVEDGVITATGAGGMWKIDGTHVKVEFVLTVDTDAGTADVTITGPGVDYEASGDLDGFSWAGTRADAPPFAQE